MTASVLAAVKSMSLVLQGKTRKRSVEHRVGTSPGKEEVRLDGWDIKPIQMLPLNVLLLIET